MSSFVIAAVGGALIGLSASILMLAIGRVAGVSGIVARMFVLRTDRLSFAPWFLAGLVAAGLLARVVAPRAFGAPATLSYGALVIAGLLVGFGTALSGGCTSGHGVCGVSRLSKRSFVATATFIATGIAAQAIVHGP